MYTYRIHINGRMEDRSFTSAISELATGFDLTGSINSAGDRLLVTCNANPETAYLFYQRILKQAPGSFTIVSHHMAAVPKEDFDCFSIKETDTEASPDFVS